MSSDKRRRGCLVALAVMAAIGLLCGGSALCLGMSAMSDPRVQLGVRAAGASMEMNQQALQGPGAQAMRDAGCRHAMSYSVEQMTTFVEEVGEQAQLAAPSRPLLVCASRRMPPDCARLAEIFGSHGEGADEVLVSAFQADVAEPRCAGAFDVSGQPTRSLSEAESRFVEVVRPRVF